MQVLWYGLGSGPCIAGSCPDLLGRFRACYHPPKHVLSRALGFASQEEWFLCMR